VQKASLRVLAMVLALLLCAQGCNLWPNRLARNARATAGSQGLQGGRVAKNSALTSPAAGTAAKPWSLAKLAPTTPVKPAKDAVSLASKATPSADLYVAAARLSERSGKVAEAERQYQQALQVDARHVGALIGYARLKDRQGQMREATQWYQRAAKAHPGEASIFNDLGICLARQRMFPASIAALERAIELDPKKPLYRNNIAMVLVENGQIDAALTHLKAVQTEAVAHYNVGYVLQKKGDSEAARWHFAKAGEKDPSLAAAKAWLNKTETQPPGTNGPCFARCPSVPADAAPRIASERRLDRQFGEEASSVRPLPPLSAQPPRATSRLEGPPAATRRAELAPLPPPSSVVRPGTSLVHPLPPVGPVGGDSGRR